MTEYDPRAAADRLGQARSGAPLVRDRDIVPPDVAGAYAVQDALLARLGAVGGWKVGAKDPDAEPGAAPLPASGLLPSGVQLKGPTWQLRGVEMELAFRLGRDID